MAVTPDVIIKIGEEELRFDPKKVLNVEAMAIEKALGLPWDKVIAGLYSGSVMAITGLVWVLRKRQHPSLQLLEVAFDVGDVEIIDPDTDERYATPEPEPEPETVPKDEATPPEPNSEPITG